jgi:hypothetical protein
MSTITQNNKLVNSYYGTRNKNRTYTNRVKVYCAATTPSGNRKKLASLEGLEPPLTVLETVVLPLHQRDMLDRPEELESPKPLGS